MKIFLHLLFFTFLITTVQAQMQTVQLNPRKLQFDGGSNLPAEKSFLVSVDAERDVDMITMQVANGSFDDNKILFQNKWRRKNSDITGVATLPNLYKLKSGHHYNFRFLYYKKLTESERQQIRSMLKSTAMALLHSNVEQKGNRFKFNNSPDDVMANLNEIVQSGMVNYELRTGLENTAFSEVTKNLLKGMAKYKNNTDAAMKSRYETLEKQVANEIDMMANAYQYVLYDRVTIDDYPVEKKSNVLALNIGYAGVYNKGNFSNLDYFSGPYAGVSFPLGNRVINGSFWNNASISAGVFLKDFKTSDSTKATGPIVKKPIYVGLGYKVFNYLKIHAGTTVLEEKNAGNNNKSVNLKPFVGLSAEFNLWLGFDKK